MSESLRSLVSLVLALALAPVVWAAPAELPHVFGGSIPGARMLPRADSHIVVRGRVVQPDLNAIADLAAKTIEGEKPHFVVDLFAGLELEAEPMTAERRPSGGTTLIARLTGVEMGTAVLTIEAGVLAATVAYPGGNFLVTQQSDGTYRVAEIDQSKFPPESPPLVPRINAPPAPSAGTSAFDVPIDSGRLIDVMVVWTAAAETAQGGAPAMALLAQAAIDNANAAYLNSGIAQRVRLVWKQAITYTETASCALTGGGTGTDPFQCALDAVTYGKIANVDTLRNTYGADLVSLFIADTSFCGLAWLLNSTNGDAAHGFSVVNGQLCAAANWSFAHEAGHNMGANHDPTTDPSPGLFAYSHGYSSPNGNWRTVMAYPGTCPAPGPCNRIAYFSNPNVGYTDGLAMGTANVSNNALTLNKSAKAVARYRDPPVVPVTNTYPAYTDVPTSNAFYGYVEFMREGQYTSGCAVGMYCPNDNVTRREMAAFLERVKHAANYNPAATGTVFTDVPAGVQFAGYIEALKADQITSGCTATTYCPDDPVRRDQMAKLILKGKCGGAYVPTSAPAVSPFTDVPAGTTFYQWVYKLYALGITSGCTATTYCPAAPVTRAAMAKLLEKAFAFGYPTETCSP